MCFPGRRFRRPGASLRDYFQKPGWAQHLIAWVNLHSKFGCYLQRALSEHRQPPEPPAKPRAEELVDRPRSRGALRPRRPCGGLGPCSGRSTRNAGDTGPGSASWSSGRSPTTWRRTGRAPWHASWRRGVSIFPSSTSRSRREPDPIISLSPSPLTDISPRPATLTSPRKRRRPFRPSWRQPAGPPCRQLHPSAFIHDSRSAPALPGVGRHGSGPRGSGRGSRIPSPVR